MALPSGERYCKRQLSTELVAIAVANALVHVCVVKEAENDNPTQGIAAALRDDDDCYSPREPGMTHWGGPQI